MGYGDDPFLMVVIGVKKRAEVLARLDCMPGHRSKFDDLFSKIDQVRFQSSIRVCRCTQSRMSSRQ